MNAAAGITEMRNAYMEKEEAKKLKQKQRDRMSAKTGKMDIAYEVGRAPSYYKCLEVRRAELWFIGACFFNVYVLVLSSAAASVAAC